MSPFLANEDALRRQARDQTLESLPLNENVASWTDDGTVTLSLSECRITLSRSEHFFQSALFVLPLLLLLAGLSSVWENEIFTTMSFRFFCQHDKVRVWRTSKWIRPRIHAKG